jgi:hypothetical protein
MRILSLEVGLDGGTPTRESIVCGAILNNRCSGLAAECVLEDYFVKVDFCPNVIS